MIKKNFTKCLLSWIVTWLVNERDKTRTALVLNLKHKYVSRKCRSRLLQWNKHFTFTKDLTFNFKIKILNVQRFYTHNSCWTAGVEGHHVNRERHLLDHLRHEGEQNIYVLIRTEHQHTTGTQSPLLHQQINSNPKSLPQMIAVKIIIIKKNEC